MAEGGAPVWAMRFSGFNQTGRPIAEVVMFNGGLGDRISRDGISALAYPSNAGGQPIEELESVLPITFLQRGLRPDSGGIGKARGGLGQTIEFRKNGSAPLRVLFMRERIKTAAKGLDVDQPRNLAKSVTVE